MNIRLEFARWSFVINGWALFIAIVALIFLGALYHDQQSRAAEDDRFTRNVRKYECARIAYQSDTWIYKCVNGMFTRLELRMNEL